MLRTNQEKKPSETEHSSPTQERWARARHDGRAPCGWSRWHRTEVSREQLCVRGASEASLPQLWRVVSSSEMVQARGLINMSVSDPGRGGPIRGVWIGSAANRPRDRFRCDRHDDLPRAIFRNGTMAGIASPDTLGGSGHSCIGRYGGKLPRARVGTCGSIAAEFESASG